MVDSLERLLAENEVRNVVARVAHLADDGDLAEYLSWFTPDASWGIAGSGAMIVGHDALLAGAMQRRADGIQGPGSGTRHINTTLWVSVDSADEASAGSYYLFLDTGTDPATVRTSGRYEDRFRRTVDGWKLASRAIHPDVN